MLFSVQVHALHQFCASNLRKSMVSLMKAIVRALMLSVYTRMRSDTLKQTHEQRVYPLQHAAQ